MRIKFWGDNVDMFLTGFMRLIHIHLKFVRLTYLVPVAIMLR